MRTPSLKEFVLKKRIWELQHEGADLNDFNTIGNLSLDKYLEVMGKKKQINKKRRGGIYAMGEELKELNRNSLGNSAIFKKRRSVLAIDQADEHNIWDRQMTTMSVEVPSVNSNRLSFNDNMKEHSDKTTSIDLKQLFRDIGPNKQARQVLRTLRVH